MDQSTQSIKISSQCVFCKTLPTTFFIHALSFSGGNRGGGESYRDAKNGEFGEPVGAISPQSDFRRLARILGIFMLK